jgi:NADH:ubiquinone oxidoreductase subunit 6 (subunit J)
LKEEVMNYSNEKKLVKELRVLLFLAVLFAAFMIVAGISKADAIDYVDNNYTGTVTRDVGADVFTEPGTEKPHLTDADGNNVHVDNGTEVLIYKEEYDADLDMWYYCTATVDGVEYTGYIYSGRITRGDPIAHTPTPTPTLAPATPTPETATSGNIQSGDIYTDNTGLNDDTQSMVEKSNSFKPWTYIILICIVIVLFMIIYTLYVKFSEEKLEREIERYSNRPQYEPLEGEADEDFEEAKSNYYDSIGLGASANKDYDDLMANQEDMDLNMDRIYTDDAAEDENLTTPSYNQNTSLDELLASLEEKLGDAEAIGDEDYDDSDEDYTDSDEDLSSDYTDEELEDFAKYDAAEEADEDYEEVVEEEPSEVREEVVEEATELEEASEEAGSETSPADDLEDLLAGLPDIPDDEPEEAPAEPEVYFKEEKKPSATEQIEIPNKLRKSKDKSISASNKTPASEEKPAAQKVQAAASYARSDMSAAQLAFRNKLDALGTKDLVRHKVYGNGVVVDNKDSQFMVVKFADGSIKYLDKDKVTVRHLLQISKK